MPPRPQRPTFIDRFRGSLDALGVRGTDAHVLVAVSGGCDSTSLLHLLRFAADDAGLRVAAAHFDHGMRAGSEGDAAWVRGVCGAWGVPLIVERAETAPRTEEEARDARYAFLRRAQAETSATHLATAHHADDQAETVLFRVLRGTGLSGLAGIPPAGEGGLVRPLLPFWRAEIVRYARAAGLAWREDATNARVDPARNRIRLRLLPQIERHLAPGARRSLARLAELARDDAAAWDAVLAPSLDTVLREEDGALVLVRERLADYDWRVAARVLRVALRRVGATPDRAGTRMALEFISHAPSGRTFTLPGGVRITTEFGTARLERAAGPAPHAPPDQSLVIGRAEPGEASFRIGGVEWTARWRVEGEVGVDDERTMRMAIDRVRFPLTLRARLPGDRVRTRAGTRPLKKLLGEARVPLRVRGTLPVLADAEGTVLWVPGVARAEGTAPAPGEPSITLSVH
ncbi:tRNA lysidine(34) synthetase TilS [Longimicrobium sp.]|uniref:tRNA lysidine(34) synthetase TilS n=1 Tax=Longimicrobium sp. TaxID=2029185 RepID=UPI003B3B3C3E